MEQQRIRINKYLSQCGVCSRREADRMIDENRVTVNGKIAHKGDSISPDDSIFVDGKKIDFEEEEIIIAYNKPSGVVCTTSRREKNNIIDAIQFGKRIYPVGRLDKESTGLILLTNNGQLMDDILRGRNCHEKEYEVTVNRPVKKEIFDAMEQGVPILNTITRPCKITHRSGKKFNIILTQGLNRQIRRMCEYFDFHVRTLKRIRIMSIELGDLKEGTWRALSQDEVIRLKEELNK